VADGHVEVVDAFIYLGCMIALGWKPEVTPLSDIHCASFDVWVRDMGHHKVLALSP